MPNGPCAVSNSSREVAKEIEHPDFRRLEESCVRFANSRDLEEGLITVVHRKTGDDSRTPYYEPEQNGELVTGALASPLLYAGIRPEFVIPNIFKIKRGKRRDSSR